MWGSDHAVYWGLLLNHEVADHVSVDVPQFTEADRRYLLLENRAAAFRRYKAASHTRLWSPKMAGLPPHL